MDILHYRGGKQRSGEHKRLQEHGGCLGSTLPVKLRLMSMRSEMQGGLAVILAHFEYTPATSHKSPRSVNGMRM